jgi:alkylhydroperoxidase family enzyme
MARIAPVDPATAPDEVREVLENLPPLNIFRTLAHAETVLRPFLRFGGAVLGRMSLDPVVRELAILAVAKEAEAEYEWIQHVEIAKAVGATDAQIEALEQGGEEALDDAQRAAVALAAAVVHSPRVSDELWERVRAQFSDREIVELLLAIGDYLMLARLMTVLEIDLDAPVGDAVLRGRRDRPGDLA